MHDRIRFHRGSVRFGIDAYQSRSERLADIMRRAGICEEKGSGVDKVVHSAEAFQLPAPDFRIGERRTSVVLFTPRSLRTIRADACRPRALPTAILVKSCGSAERGSKLFY